jgi:polyisoprenoid-binding protein YceI
VARLPGGELAASSDEQSASTTRVSSCDGLVDAFAGTRQDDCLEYIGWLARQAKEMHLTMMRPGIPLKPGAQLQPAAGRWRVDPVQSHASFAARVAGRPLRGRLPLTGRVFIADPIEDSTARVAARAGQVSTGFPVLDRQLAGPRFLDSGTFPEISFRSEMLAWVPTGWRAIGCLQVKGAEHELACRLDLDRGGEPLDDSLRLRITSSWVIDSRWITRQWIPGLSRRIPMVCSFLLEPDL